jgi:hypothetical protein
MEKVVNIIGMGPGAIDAPWKNETDHFWGINNAYIYGRLDIIFMMHTPEDTIRSSFVDGRERIPLDEVFIKYPDMVAVSLDKIIFLKNLTTNKYAHAPFENLDKLKKDKNYKILFITERYPIEKATALSGTVDYSCSAPYLIAMAILQGYERIRLYGFEVWSRANKEYTDEAPCIERWISLARGHGIKTDCPFSIIPTNRQARNFYGYYEPEGN